MYVEDVIDAYLACLKLKNFDQRIFNICSGTQTSIEQTAKMIVELAKSHSKIKIGSYQPRPWDTNYWVADNRKAKKLLGWEPKYTLEEGLKKTISWFSKNLDYYV